MAKVIVTIIDLADGSGSDVTVEYEPRVDNDNGISPAQQLGLRLVEWMATNTFIDNIQISNEYPISEDSNGGSDHSD